mgnify:CR=1 FL=1
MKNFKYDYDKENDDLLIYLDGEKSGGSVELGNFVFDFDENKNLVGIEIFEASKVLSNLTSKFIQLTKIKNLKARVVNFRGMVTIQIIVTTNEEKNTANVIIPRLKQESSPALDYE